MSKFHAVFGLGLLLAAVVLVSRVPNSVGADITAPAENKAVAIGAPAPAWKDLAGVDGKTHSLADLAKAKAVVVVFTCNHCPVAQGYEDRLNQLVADYKDKNVEVVAINVSNMEVDKLPAMKEHAEEKGLKFAYLYDPSQAIGHAFGASVTPHAFVLDGNRNVVYMGAIDDNMMADKVTQHYVRDAVESALRAANRQPQLRSNLAVASNTNRRRVNVVADWLVMLGPAAMILCAGCGSPAAPQSAPAPKIQVVDRAAYDKIIAGLHGKVVLVDFWATWCGPCVAQLPHVVMLEESYGKLGLAVVTVSLDDAENIEQARTVLSEKHANSLTNLLSQYGGTPQSIEEFHINGGATPHYKLYDRDGQLRKVFAIDPTATKQYEPGEIDAAVATLITER